MSRLLPAAIAAALFFGAAAFDLGLRSRDALGRARRYEAWAADPAQKKKFCAELLAEKTAAARAGLAAGELTEEEAARRVTLAETEAGFIAEESSAKLAWLWYRTAAEKFPSPLNPWAAEARRRLPAAKAAWLAELAAAGLKPPAWLAD